MNLFVVSALLLAGIVSFANAQLVDENLLSGLPDGYKVGYQKKTGNQLINELVPKSETVNDWTEMLTIQIFFGNKTAPAQFKAGMEKMWAASCQGSTSQPVFSGNENDYPTVLWMQDCPRNKQTGKPEITWFKAIGGNDSLYLVQKAFKFEPSKKQITTWMQYLKKVSVCDTRRADRPCPQVKRD